MGTPTVLKSICVQWKWLQASCVVSVQIISFMYSQKTTDMHWILANLLLTPLYTFISVYWRMYQVSLDLTPYLNCCSFLAVSEILVTCLGSLVQVFSKINVPCWHKVKSLQLLSQVKAWAFFFCFFICIHLIDLYWSSVLSTFIECPTVFR